MIKFACRCSHPFAVDDDQAGASLQCPKCGLLVDVPTLSDAAHLTPEGFFTISEDPQVVERNRLNKLYRTFTRDSVDPNTGEEIDLRLQPADVASDRIVDPMHIKGEPRDLRPKYDPITGELVRPIDVAGEERNPAINTANIPKSSRTVTYASRATSTSAQSIPGFFSLAVMLLQPINIVVMFFTALAYLAGQFFLATVFLFFVDLPIAAFLLSHYGNVIDEIGPEMRDELPRPLRHVELGPDLWWPFFAMFVSIVICYSPSISILIQRLPWPFAVAAAIAGSFVLPAVMLTMTTSGTILNMRPDRVFNLIAITGFRYFVAVAIWIVALAFHLWTWIGVRILADELQHNAISRRWAILDNSLVVYPMIAVAIYFMHLYCSYLGMLYRRHHDEFPWVLQQHNRGVTSTGYPRRTGFTVIRPAPAAGRVPQNTQI
ncbi:MAG TPA: hypothetical protein VFE58_18350 [Tepidisphaeraceae bacterium]|jgi:hypothetical protein|nr:hypothetical protein [Tepidisphaeraceae bacterium]